MKMLAEDIKNGNFKTAYLFCGEEAYLRNQYKNRLAQALCDPSRPPIQKNNGTIRQ